MRQITLKKKQLAHMPRMPITRRMLRIRWVSFSAGPVVVVVEVNSMVGILKANLFISSQP